VRRDLLSDKDVHGIYPAYSCLRYPFFPNTFSWLSLPGVREELDAHFEEERGEAAGNPNARVAQPPLPARVVRRVVLAASVLESRVVEKFLPKSKHANSKRTSIEQNKTSQRTINTCIHCTNI